MSRPAQINVQMPIEYTDRTSVSLYSRVTHADGSITVSAPIGVTIVPQNPGIFAGGGSDPRPGLVYHASSAAIDAFALNGSVTSGDVMTISIGTAPGATTHELVFVHSGARPIRFSPSRPES